jgi:hypothetical protein
MSLDQIQQIRHLGRHMEDISYTVVTKPYEDWEFYNDINSSESEHAQPGTVAG